MIRIIGCMLIFISIVGCTTMDDFQKMSATDRANKVCSTRSQYSALSGQKQQYSASISTAQQNLSRGYIVHTQCKNVQVQGNSTMDCHTDNYGNTNCNQYTPTQTQQQCTDIPVPLNYDLEKDKLVQYQRGYSDANDKLNAFWRSCTNNIYNLSPEDAYAAFKR